jgi:RNA polymerase sigma-70 factor, ECF subfamily
MEDSGLEKPVIPAHVSGDLGITLYNELRRIAAAQMRLERRNHTLQPTALVHEVCIRLSPDASTWRDRSRLLGYAAYLMRRILVDHARRRNAGKRGGGVQVTLTEDMAVAKEFCVDVLSVDAALTGLAEFDERQAKIVELRFFGGLTFEEIGVELGLSARTIKRDWTMARAWLHQNLATDR